ncbi:DNA-binding beta-propeller fold protein YncE [Acinetobacter sp. BIGb0102]|uniref:choice-of-anchor I family protein n=1 Tax=Acinetobacter sp. BIGb0102 TaxID=2485131 RepID=UPI000F5114FC|nr:choice-of-anchor I family protein [Acinetobacter sp. BIGb0102]RPE47613.1 DNA-binding beta-propeller fold protein YncE [Acinetobacter sp. BIGb0102]
MKFKISVLLTALLSVGLVACNDDNDNSTPTPEIVEPTPETIKLSLLGRYETNIFAQSAAEIPAYDAETKRLFVVNAQKGLVDVLDASKPEKPIHIAELSARTYLANSEVNSVAVKNGIVALAVQAEQKTDTGIVVFFNAKDLSFISKVSVGALPDMLTFSPDGKTVLVANEGEPNDDYSVDPEGSVSIIDISNIKQPKANVADFKAWNTQKADLLAKGVRIFGPNASVAQDLEPEYIAISADSKTAWVTLQENNAIARIDIAQQKVTDIYPLGYKDHGVVGNELDVSDKDKKIDIKTWAGLVGMYQPDSIANYQANGQTYLVTANEGDSREWLKDSKAYYAGDTRQGFVENIRMKHLFNSKGFNTGGDYPAHLQKLAVGVKGAKLNPVTFAYCGATETGAGGCRDDAQLGRLNIAWNMGYQTNADGSPKLDANGLLTYDKLYAYGARSFSIWNTQGQLVWDSGSEFEKKTAELFPDYFNSDHEAVAFDDRSDNKGPEPEGITVGSIGQKTFAFIGLERMSGIMVYDISTPNKPKFIEYFTTRNFTETETAKQGDLGPEGLIFIAAKDSPNGKPLLVVGNEVSGSTAVYQVNVH